MFKPQHPLVTPLSQATKVLSLLEAPSVQAYGLDMGTGISTASVPVSPGLYEGLRTSWGGTVARDKAREGAHKSPNGAKCVLSEREGNLAQSGLFSPSLAVAWLRLLGKPWGPPPSPQLTAPRGPPPISGHEAGWTSGQPWASTKATRGAAQGAAHWLPAVFTLGRPCRLERRPPDPVQVPQKGRSGQQPPDL